MFWEQTISLLSVTYRLCWVCDWLAFDLAICHINYSGDVDLLYEDQDLNCYFCCRYIANICSTCKQILVWIVISCYWEELRHTVFLDFFLKTNRLKCDFWQNVFVSYEAQVQSPPSTFFSVVHVLKRTEWIHKVVMLKYMNQWSDKARQFTLTSMCSVFALEEGIYTSFILCVMCW